MNPQRRALISFINIFGNFVNFFYNFKLLIIILININYVFSIKIINLIMFDEFTTAGNINVIIIFGTSFII